MATIRGKIIPLRNTVFVTELESGNKMTAGGIVVLDDNMKDSGIRPRWGKVWSVGPEVDDIQAGQWILIKHGRWTYGMDVESDNGEVFKIWRVEYPDSVELVSDENPLDTISVR